MGQVKTTELPNGNLGLEITYGGKESPFGGVDTSAPPAYIDPRCFTLSDGFLVVDNKLVAVSVQAALFPTLWGGTVATLLKIGTFYNSLTGQLNYALGYTAVPFVGPPSGVNYTFYITAWNPASPATYWDDTLTITLFDAQSIIQQASLTLDCIASQTSAISTGSGATGTITSVGSGGQITGITMTGGVNYGVGDGVQVVQGSSVGGWVLVTGVTGTAISTVSILNKGDLYVTGAVTAGDTEGPSGVELVVIGPSGTQYITVPAYSSGYTRQQLVAAMIGTYNDVTITSSIDGFSIIITANVPGVGGNAITVQDISTSEVSANPPPLYFSCRTARNLQGGQITESATAPRSFVAPASTCIVGGTLYIANVGPMILKYSGPGLFTTSTMYNGVGVIRKFAGSLIGLRVQNQLGVYTQNQDMIFAWSAGEDLDEWSPVSNTGNVTGAGFEELADIADYLTGLIVTNGTAFIIRSNGISYATATGNATLPFAVNHIGLGEQGEGAQVTNLVCQYDQTGAFVGNTDIFQISSQVGPIGQKIKALLFQSLRVIEEPGLLSAAAIPVMLGGDTFPLVIFSAGPTVDSDYPTNSLALYIFNPGNGTWMILSMLKNLPGPLVAVSMLMDVFASLNTVANNDEYNQALAVFGTQSVNGMDALQAPELYQLVEGVPNGSATPGYCPSGAPFVIFPQEEVMFGRDVTIDALYIALWAAVSENTTVTFYINEVQYAVITLTPVQFFTLQGEPIELQVNNFSSTVVGTGAFTAHSPQLKIEITPLTDAGSAQVRFSKIAMFASFDPKQRPV